VHGLVSSQLVHGFPPAPHSDALSPGWQAAPSQHPTQQAPLRQTPPLHVVPSGCVPPVQNPATQVPVAHSPAAVHDAQAAPAAPHAAAAVPGLQAVPSQHPEHWLALQIPPQPSSAPAHSPWHCGTQLHLPLGLQVPPEEHVPHLPPQLSLPHSLPAQIGLQLVHFPPLHAPPLDVQSTQGAPPWPQRSTAAPT
jgi:hypothetical protein